MRKTLLILGAVVLLGSSSADAAPSLEDYRHFRALAIDLEGRIPTASELAAFEAPSFDLDAFLDQKLAQPGYADRVSRIYMDLLRLQVSPVFRDAAGVVALHRETIVGPDGQPMYVYYRAGQRRVRAETDGDFCMTADETGLQFRGEAGPIPYPMGTTRTTGTPVTQAVLDANTVVVPNPWWLYKDFRSASPTQRYDATWAQSYGFTLTPGLTTEPDGKTPTATIRVCKEEAQTADTGHVYASGRAPYPAGPPPFGRYYGVPGDDAYAKAHTNEVISCRTQSGFQHAVDCGCGASLEHCFPVAGSNPQAAPTTVGARLDVFGPDMPIDVANQSLSDWNLLWFSEEARQFMQHLFGDDKDFREMLSSPSTWVNGPLAQYYKDSAPGTCCGNGIYFGQTSPVGLVDPAVLPPSLAPFDTRTWIEVPARSDQAAGILTMPVFLSKYGTRRSKAHVLYNAFLCKDFIAPPNLKLTPSTDPNLMTRSGCSTCHATLEPMAAYFSRIVESDVTFLPASTFPTDTKAVCSGGGPLPAVCGCKLDAKGKMSGGCAQYFDPAFSDATHGVLRGAYPDVVGASKSHADLGPRGMASELVAHPEFASCVARNVASSFLGRSLGPDDDALAQSLEGTLVAGGFKMRGVVRAMLKSDAYRRANNLSASAWRKEQGGSK